jgi:hypothetical protein
MEAPRKPPFSVRQWLKEYGPLAALVGMALGLGVPGLSRLGAMREQIRGLDTAIREEVTPELQALREGVTPLREGMAELRTRMSAVERSVDRLDGKMDHVLHELRRGQQPRKGE